MGDIEAGKQEAYTLLEEHDQFTGAKLNLNSFLAKVYKYYNGKGLFCILLARSLTVIAYGFLLFWILFLFAFVDYTELFTSYSLQKAVSFDLNRVHPVLAVFEILFGSFWLWLLIKLPFTLREYWEIRAFYRDQLRITSTDLQWMRWSEVTHRLAQIKELSWSKDELTPLDIANIVMRRENYWIALTNHNVLQLPSWTMSGQIFEWGVTLAVFDLLTSPVSGVRLDVLRTHDATLARRLAHRSRVLGVLGLVLAPFVLVALLATALARYGPELRSRPSLLATRGWTGHARWQFRDFNELPHYCDERLDKAHKPASKYIDSFQSYALTLLAKFALFILGAVLVVFIVLSLIDDTVLTRLEIIPGHWTAIVFLGVVGSAFAVVRGLLPDEPVSEDPNELMLQIAGLTHQLPDEWIDRAHTYEVRDHFSALFQLRVVLFVQELFSVLTTPLLLLFVLPKRAEHIVRFFNEFTVFQEGLGPVCKFATFDLSAHGNKEYGATKSTDDRHKQTKHGKLEMSMINFKAHYPEWQSRDCEELLQRAAEVDEDELLSAPMDRSTMTRTLLMHKVAHNARSDPALRSHYSASRLDMDTHRARRSSAGLSPLILETADE